MNLEKAIEILDLELTCDFDGNERDRKNAVKLGIEALKRVIVNRQPIRAHWREPLPGETKE